MKRTTLLPPDPGERLAFGLALLWMGLVLFHYFPPSAFLDFSFLRPPASDLRHMDPRGLAANLPGFLKTVFVSFAALFTLWRWGRKGRRWLGFQGGNPALRFCLETALGVLFFNGLWMGLGLSGLWRAPLLWALAPLFFGLALWDLLARPLAFQKFPRFEDPGKGGWVLAGLGAVVFLLGLGQSLVPEVYYDALVYHLSTLQFWQYHHGIADFPTNLYSYYPFGAELYLMNGFFFQGGESAKMLDTLAVFLCALAAAGWVAEEAGVFEGCLAWAMVWAFPLTSATAWACQNDALLAFFVLLFLRGLWRWSAEPGNRQRALAAGLWAGAALSIKYTAVLWVLLPLGLWALAGRGLFKGKKGAGFLFGAICLSAAPWFLKNWAYTGNGFYPYFSSWVGGRGLYPRGLQALMADHETVFGKGFQAGAWLRQVVAGDLDKTIGPFLFCFLPFLFLPGRRPPAAKFLGVTGGLFLLAGFLVTHQLRLLMPAFLVCFIAMAVALGGIKGGAWARAWGGLTAVLGLWSLLALLRLGVGYYQSDRVWLGLQTPEAYLNGSPQTSSYFDLTRAVGLLPEGDRVLVVGDARGLYYPRPFYTNSTFDEPLLARLALAEKDGEGIGRRLREMGIDDLAVSGVEGVRISSLYHAYDLPPQAWKRLDDFIRRFTDPVYLSGRKGIYRLRPTPGRGKAPFPDLLLLFREGRNTIAAEEQG